jgi:hypothetical protein
MTEAQTEPQPKDAKQLPIEVFREMERRDENQILAELRGELLEEFVYSISIDGRQVTNMTYAGIKEASRRRGDMEILEVRTEADDKEFRALVRVRDHQNKIDVVGASSCERNKPFAYVLAVNKAERNAFAKLIPAKWLALLIQEYLGRQKEGTKHPTEVPPTKSPSPARVDPVQAKPVPAWKVPATPNQVSPDQIQQGVRQFPLLKELHSFGMVNVLGEEIAVIPERPVSLDTALIEGFLIRRVIEPLVAKHGLSYTFKRTSNGFLEAVLIRGKLPDQQLREVISGARWAFERALEEKKA